MLTVWNVKVKDGYSVIDNIFFQGTEPIDHVVQYMLERVYGEKKYGYADEIDNTDGDNVIIRYFQDKLSNVTIFVNPTVPNITINKEKMTLVQDLGYCEHNLIVNESYVEE